MTNEKVWTVTEVNSAVRELIEGSFHPFWIGGEVGTFRPNPRSGHVYFTLKDSNCEIRAVYFNGLKILEKLNVSNGSHIEAGGRLTVYEPRGEYQFNVREVRIVGFGELYKRLDELKRKLEAEGLFDASHKKKIPAFPRKIGIVTSPSGAAIRDFLQIINRRFPNVQIRIFPSAVQGKGAEKELAEGITFFNRTRCADVIILMRGGGSIEDLWPFNEELLARAIVASKIPIISAVGHEIDVTISDLVADLRVPTPSAAAELVIASQDQYEKQILDYRRRLASSMNLALANAKKRLIRASGSYVFKEPEHLLRIYQQKLDELSRRAENTIISMLDRIKMKHTNLRDRLASLNPQAVLKRGYSITYRSSNMQIIKNCNELSVDESIITLLAEGKLESKVIKK